MENTKIEQTLRENTQDLKILFIDKIKKQAENDLELAKKIYERTTKDWCDFLGIETYTSEEDKHFYKWQIDNGKTNIDGSQPTLPIRFPENFYKTDDYKTILKLKNELYSVFYTKDYVGKMIKWAENHYENSIIKLVNKLVKKGVNDNFVIIKKRLGINFEMIIKTDLGKIIKCWTIIAEGEIQKAHYRFLVK